MTRLSPEFYRQRGEEGRPYILHYLATGDEGFHSDEGLMSRPFMPGWRAESVRRAKQFWREHGRVRFSMRRLLST